MNWHRLFDWLPSRSAQRTKRVQTPVPPWRFVRPRLERLESRIAPAVVTPFTPVFSANATGDIAIIGNTLETATTTGNPGRTATDVANAQNGTGSFVNNNDWNMAYVNVAPGTGIFDSSTAALNLPTGATVLFAGLYWMGNSSSASRSQVLFATPTSGGAYTTINGSVVGDSSKVTPAPSPSGPNYEGYDNVTSLVKAAGNGNYTVANVQATIGTNYYAGWSLVVAYQAPGEPARNLTVFNGYATVNTGDPPLNIPISGFIAPPSGAVNAKVGVVAGEGDLSLTGDSMQVNGKALSDAVNPANNFFDSVISNQGVRLTAKNPNYADQLGFDAKVVNVPSGVIPNSATSATVTLTTNGDVYFPGVVTTSINLFAPLLSPTSKTVTDLTHSGGPIDPGDILQYTVNVTNSGQDPAGSVVLTDPIPADATYVPGSLQITSGANAGPKSDAAGDDQAEFDAAANDVVFRLGTGANAATGGMLAIGASTAISFEVEIDPDVPANTVIANQANVAYTGVTTGFSFTATSNVATVTVTNSEADLAVTKTVSDLTPNVGEEITYTTTVTNNGPGSATGVTLNDLLPPGLQLLDATTSQGAYDGGTGLWTVGSLANGASATLTISAEVNSPDPQTNTAVISHTDSIDPDPSNNSASTTETPQIADLFITKTVNNPTPNVGDVITFTVTLGDNGPDDANGVFVTDQLPVGLTFVSATTSTGTYSPRTGQWVVGTVTTTTPQTLTIQARVVSPNPLTNTATIIGAAQFDPNPDNNTASATETPQQADLDLSKTVDDLTPGIGDTIHYTITLADNGPDAATNVSVLDQLPAGLAFVSDTPSEGTYDPTTGIWTVGTVTTSAVQTLIIAATVMNRPPIANTAMIEHSDQYDPDASNNIATALVNPQMADLALSKTVDDPTPNVGDVITFTVTLSDNGPNDATGVIVSDPLPAGLTFVSATPSEGTYDPTTGIWTVGAVAIGTPQTLLVQATVVSPDPTTNTATIISADQLDPDTDNNTASATETPQIADLAISKGVDNPAPGAGGTINYTITLADNGPDTATNVTVQDILPSGVTFVSDTPSEGTYDPTTGVWTVGTVNTTTVQTLTITAVVNAPEQSTNTATITHSDQYDPDLSNNTATASILPLSADLEVVKQVNNPTPNVGDTITFTITLLNNGPDNATGVVVTDLLPSGLTFVSDTPSEGTYDPTTGIWTVGAVTTTTPQTLLISAEVVSPDPQTNTVTITSETSFDPNPDNNTSSVTETPQIADLELEKTVNNPTPNVGDTIIYTLTLNDLGPDPATNVAVQDLLPSGVMFVSATPSEGSYNPTTGVWTVGTVDTTAAQTLMITATVTGVGALTNTATITHSDQFDSDPANNTASTVMTSQQADLEVTKTVSNPTPNVGDTIIYTLTLTDSGPDAATGVAVSDLLPPGLTFVSDTPSEGTYDPTTGVWNVGAVAVGSPQTLQIAVTVVSPDPITNTATVAHSDQFDPDLTNNTASATETPQQADLAVTKMVDNTTPNVGDIVNFTITVNDLGPDDATNVSVQDLLPAGLAFVSATPSEGTYDPTTGVWTVGTVDTTNAQTLVIAARVTSPNTFTNTASVLHSDQYDPNPANNIAEDGGTPQEDDLVLTKDVNNRNPNVGDTIYFSEALTNDGPDTATNVTVSEPLPAGLTFVSALPSQGTYDPTTGVWTVGTVQLNTMPTLEIVARVASPGTETNTATITHSDQFNLDTTNNSASATVIVESPLPPPPPSEADVNVTKEVNETNPVFGTPVTYTLFVHNNGPDTATGVTATDTLPAGLIFVTATPSQGSFDAGNGQWTIGTLANGATVSLQIIDVVAAIGPIPNTASVTALQADPDVANNVSSVTIDGMYSAAQVSKSMFLSSGDAPPNAATVASEEALFNAAVSMWVNLWDALLSLEQSLLAARDGPGNGGIPVFEGNWLGSPLVVYANPFAGQVTAVQVGAFDFLYENNTVAGLRPL